MAWQGIVQKGIGRCCKEFMMCNASKTVFATELGWSCDFWQIIWYVSFRSCFVFFVCFILILVYLYFSSSVSFSICGYSFRKWKSFSFCKEKDKIKEERLNECVYDLIVSFLIALWLCCTQAYARDQIYDEYTQKDIWKRDNIFFFIWE